MNDLLLELDDWPKYPFVDRFILPTSEMPLCRKVYKPSLILNQSVLRLIKEYGLIPERLTIFHQRPGFTGESIHTDGTPGDPRYAVNWMLGDSTFSWYRAVDKRIPPPTNLNTRGFITVFDPTAVEKIYTTKSNGPFLANIGVPHKGENFGTGNRWACSLRFYNRFPNWSATYDFFKSKALQLS